MRALFFATGTILTAIAHVPAQAETVVLQPSSAWNVDFGENKCRLLRLFTDGTSDHLLYFEQHWPARGTSVTAAGRLFKPFQSRADTQFRTSDDQPPQQAQPYKGEIERFEEALIFSGLDLSRGDNESDEPPAEQAMPQLDTDFAETVKFLAFRQRGREIQYNTGPLGAAFKILNQCSADLVKEWGLDAERHKTARKRPNWINEQEITRKIVANYPRAAASRGEQGIMRMRIIVSEAGLIEDCIIIKATTTEKLESPACKAMEQARFEPAIDANGQPMRSYYATTITYRFN